MKTNHKTRLERSEGFTIVELMIATMVFSTILVAISIGVMYFTRSYYKGVYESTTQNAARNVAESITKAIQFGATGNTIEGPYKGASDKDYLCAGGYIFVYEQGTQYTGSSGSGFYSQPLTGNCSGPPAMSSAAHQYLGKNMRIASLTKNFSDGTYTVSVTVAYGDDDLLTSTSGDAISCKTGSGSAYCAVSRVTATATPRIAN